MLDDAKEEVRKFQKDLIVWKPGREREGQKKREVSEGLNSVETEVM